MPRYVEIFTVFAQVKDECFCVDKKCLQVACVYKLLTPTGYKWNKTDHLSLIISIYREKARYQCNTNRMLLLLHFSIARQ